MVVDRNHIVLCCRLHRTGQPVPRERAESNTSFANWADKPPRGLGAFVEVPVLHQGEPNACEGGKSEGRGINGNLPHGPLRGSMKTDARRWRQELQADLRYLVEVPIGADPCHSRLL